MVALHACKLCAEMGNVYIYRASFSGFNVSEIDPQYYNMQFGVRVYHLAFLK